MKAALPRRAKRLILILAALAVICALLLVLLPRDIEEPEAKPWTVMVYMVDCVQELALNRDLNEMRGALQPDTQLLVLIAGMDQGECRLYRMDPEETLLSSWEGRAGDGDTLAHLLRAGDEISEGQTALIFWDHGYGPVEGFGGLGGNTAEERLSLPETAETLKACGFDRHPLTVIGFDGCMMAGCETAVTLAPYARYLIASQETEASDGWDYGFLARIHPETGGEDFGRLVIADYAAFYQALYAQYDAYWQPYTLSLIDLTRAQSLADGICAYLNALEENLESGGFSDVSRLRLNVWGFGRGTTSTEYDVIDLYELASMGRAVYPEAAALLDVLEQCVVDCAGDQQRAHGLSIFFPGFAEKGNLAAWQDQADALPLPESWRRFLIRYCEALTADRSVPSVEMAAFEEDAVRFTLSDEALSDFAYAKYYLLNGSMEEGMYLLCATNSYSLEGNTLTVPYERKLYQISDGRISDPIVTFIGQEDDEHVYCRSYAVAMLKPASGGSGGSYKGVYLRSIQDKETGEWQVLTAFATSSNLVTGRQEILLSDVSDLMVYFGVYAPAYDAAGRLLPWHQWRDTDTGYYDSVSVGNGLTLEAVPLPENEGTYWLQVVIVDTHNQQYSAALLPLN